MAGTSWTPAEDAALAELYPVSDNRDLTEIMNERFGTSRTGNAIRQHAIKLGIRKAEGYKHPARKTFWNDERREWFCAFVPGHSEAEISAEHERLFGEPLTEGQIGGGKYAFGVKSGTVGGRFEPGHETWNKGRTWDELGISDESREKMLETSFKKGEIRDRPDGWIKPIGYERVNRDGYIEVKVRDSIEDGPQPRVPGKYNCNYRFKHHVVWEQAHGEPVPEGCNIVFADGDKRNFDPANLVAVPRKVWSTIARSGLEYYDAESLAACVSLAEFVQSIHGAEMAPRDCRACGNEFEPRYPRQRTCDTCLGRDEKGASR